MRAAVLILVSGLAATGAVAQSGGGAATGVSTGSSSTVRAPRTQMQGRGIKVLSAGDAGSASPAPQPAPPPVAPPAPVVATPVQVPPTPVQVCSRPFPTTDLRLGSDAKAADLLAKRLRKGQRVTIDLVAPYPVRSDTPAPLGAWFSAVKASGGVVDVAPYCDQGSRGFLSRLFGLSSSNDPGKAYRSAKLYDVVVYNDARAKTVTQVEFVPRGTRKVAGQ